MVFLNPADVVNDVREPIVAAVRPAAVESEARCRFLGEELLEGGPLDGGVRHTDGEQDDAAGGFVGQADGIARTDQGGLLKAEGFMGGGAGGGAVGVEAGGGGFVGRRIRVIEWREVDAGFGTVRGPRHIREGDEGENGLHKE